MAGNKQIVGYGQTLVDMAVQYYGCIEGAWKIFTDNATIASFSDIPQPGAQLKIDITPPAITNTNVVIAGAFATRKYQSASWDYPAPPQEESDLLTEDNLPILTESGQHITLEAAPLDTEAGEHLETEDNQNLNIH